MAVDYTEFIATVQREGALPSEPEAVRAAQAALQTLAERLSGGEARHLARRLPERLRTLLSDGEQAESFGVDEYLHRVARREGVDGTAAARHALAVFAALGSAVGSGEVRDMDAELPRDFRALLVAAEAAAARASRGGRKPTAEDFVARVAETAGIGLDAARRAADAVLDALGERISTGQVSDLAACLPDEPARALKRGDARSKGEVKALSLVEFTRHVSDLEGVAPAAAREHARAVFLALRATVGEQEFHDTVAQLPSEYRTFFDPDPDPDVDPATTTSAPGDQALAARHGSPAPDAATEGAAPEVVEVHAPKDLPREALAAARTRLAGLQRYVGRPILGARLTLRHPESRKARSRWVADASIDLQGRLIAAHAAGRDALEATDTVVDRLRRQIHRVAGKDVALRNEPRVIARALAELPHEVVHRPETHARPAEERRVVHRRLVADQPMSAYDAVAELLDADEEFRLFRHDATGEWLVVYRRDDGRIGLIHPSWVPVTVDVTDVLVVEPTRLDRPVTVEEAQAELAGSGRRFLYFVDAADAHPKVLYLRHDGHYGIVEPAV